MRRPNVLLISTDQQRFDTIRAAGNEHMHTPNLDALAASGTLFTHACCNSPVCMPSRQSFMSGQQPWALNRTANGQEMPEDVPCIQHLLGGIGYHTAQIGKLHFTNIQPRDRGETHPRYGFDTMILAEHNTPGFRDQYDLWVDEREPDASQAARDLGTKAYWDAADFQHPYEQFNGSMPLLFQADESLTLTAMVVDEACDFVARDHASPWFAHVGIFAPHNPFNPPQRFAAMYDPDKLPDPVMNDEERAASKLSAADWRASKAHYYGHVSEIDEQVGRLMQRLEETGQRDNTLVIFMSDHGDHNGDHGRGGKGAPGWDACLRVPLIVSWPGRVAAGQKRSEVVELIDIVPTILDLCVCQAPPCVQGRSMRAMLEGKADDRGKADAFMQIGQPTGAQWFAIRNATHKLCLSNTGERLLYDLEADPGELHNVCEAPAYREVRAALTDRLVQRIFEARPHVPRYNPYW